NLALAAQTPNQYTPAVTTAAILRPPGSSPITWQPLAIASRIGLDLLGLYFARRRRKQISSASCGIDQYLCSWLVEAGRKPLYENTKISGKFLFP
ncbi:MAG: hypothetical protein AAF530_20665, partial [Pseudomonadota bacterium]